MGFPRQEYWSGLPFSPPRDLPDCRIQLIFPVSLALEGRFFTTEPPVEAPVILNRAYSGAMEGFPGDWQLRICLQRRRPRSDPWLGKIPWRRGMASRSTILTWRILWTGKPGGLQSIRSQRVGHEWVTHTFTFRSNVSVSSFPFPSSLLFLSFHKYSVTYFISDNDGPWD